MRYILLLLLVGCNKIEQKSFTGSIHINESVPIEYRSAIIDAANIWNDHKGCTVIEINSVLDTSSHAERDGVNSIYWLNTWEDERVNEQARATIYFQGSLIYETDVKINAKNFIYWNGAKDKHVDLVSLMVHELGHCLGLQHSNDVDSVMRSSLSSGKERRIPSMNDLDRLKCL